MDTFHPLYQDWRGFVAQPFASDMTMKRWFLFSLMMVGMITLASIVWGTVVGYIVKEI